MRIVVIGVGGVGGYFGGRLVQAREDVVFIARGETLQALRTKGLKVESVKGDFALPSIQVTDDPKQVGPADAILLAVKSWQVPEMIDVLRPIIGPETFIVPLQNGVEAPGQLADAFGKERVLGGLARILSYQIGPGEIRHIGAEPSLAFGEMDNQKSERAERLRQAFAGAGVTAEIPQDINVALWTKLLFVASWGGVGAVTRAPIGVLRSLPETRQMIEQAMREIIAVARTRNVIMPEETAGRAMTIIDKMPPNGTPSLQRDIIEGKPSELDAWNGVVVRLGKEGGIATPLHSFIYQSLLPLELQARGKLEF